MDQQIQGVVHIYRESSFRCFYAFNVVKTMLIVFMTKRVDPLVISAESILFTTYCFLITLDWTGAITMIFMQYVTLMNFSVPFQVVKHIAVFSYVTYYPGFKFYANNLLMRMENWLVHYLILEPVEQLRQEFNLLLRVIYSSMIATIISVPVLQKISSSVIYAESVLYGAVYFMKTNNSEASFWTVIAESFILGIIYHADYLKSVLLVLIITGIEWHVKYANVILMKCLYFSVMLALGIPNDVAAVIVIFSFLYHYMVYKYKSKEDFFLLAAVVYFFKSYFESIDIEDPLAVLYYGFTIWLISKTLSVGLIRNNDAYE